MALIWHGNTLSLKVPHLEDSSQGRKRTRLQVPFLLVTPSSQRNIPLHQPPPSLLLATETKKGAAEQLAADQYAARHLFRAIRGSEVVSTLMFSSHTLPLFSGFFQRFILIFPLNLCHLVASFYSSVHHLKYILRPFKAPYLARVLFR